MTTFIWWSYDHKNEAQHNFKVSFSASQNSCECYKYEVKMTMESSFCQMLHDLRTLITNEIISWIKFPPCLTSVQNSERFFQKGCECADSLTRLQCNEYLWQFPVYPLTTRYFFLAFFFHYQVFSTDIFQVRFISVFRKTLIWMQYLNYMNRCTCKMSISNLKI